MITNNKKPELLAPAGDMEKLRFAVAYGADAVYLGGEEFGLRVKSNNFTIDEMKEAVAYCHQREKKVYVTVNIFAHNEDIAALPAYLKALAEMKPDALLISDPGVFTLARRYAPEIPIHISTQANNVNWETARFWQSLGAERVVLGRELSLAEIAEIREKTDIALEMFVHGAMCMSYSGRCLLSNYLTRRDSNRGACTHPCRWRYALVEEKRPNEYLPVEEDARGSYIMNSEDLNLLDYLPALCEIGVDSLKIEGRVKSSYYVAIVTKAYRQALDCLFETPTAFAPTAESCQALLRSVSHRKYGSGFLERKPQAAEESYNSSAYEREYDFVAVVTGYDTEKKMIELEQRNHFAVGETLTFVPAQGDAITISVAALYDGEGLAIAKAPHAQMRVYLPAETVIPPLTVVGRKKDDV